MNALVAFAKRHLPAPIKAFIKSTQAYQLSLAFRQGYTFARQIQARRRAHGNAAARTIANLTQVAHRLGAPPTLFEDIYSYQYALDMMDKMLSTIDNAKLRDEIERKITEYFFQLKDRVAIDVTPEYALHPERASIESRVWKTYTNRGLWHLELGSWTAFPDERVQDIVQAHGLGNFIRLDFNPQYAPDLAADCMRLPFQDRSLDFISSNSLFEHVPYPDRIIAESYRCLAPGGCMRVTMPFHFVLHDCPGDYTRLTPQYFERVCRDVGFDEVLTHVHDTGGVYFTLHNSSKAATRVQMEDPEINRFTRAVHHNIITLLALATPLDYYFDNQGRQFFHAVKCWAFKKGELRDLRNDPRGSAWSTDRAVRLEKLIPILRCPNSGQPLARFGEELVTSGGMYRYPIVNGIPCVM